MSDLVRFYKNYYREQTPASIDSLFKAILNYDFSTYQEDMLKILRMHCETKCLNNGSKLYTNGSSSGEQRYFYFAPHFNIWQHKLEPFLRSKEHKTIMLITMLGQKCPSNFSIQEVWSSSQKDFDVSLNWASEEDIEKLFAFVNQVYEEHGKINLYSIPYIWTSFVTNSFFRNLAISNAHKIHAIVSGDSDAYFKRLDLYVRDQMIDWGTGMNFFKCANDKKHFLPIFFYNEFGSINLLNLKSNSIRTDDLFKLNFETCLCGRRCFAEIECHFANRIKDSKGALIDIQPLIDKLNSHYGNLQIHQNLAGDITVYSSVIKDENDSDLIENYFEKRGLKTDFVADRYYTIGRKRYISWRSASIDTQNFIKQEQV